MGGATTFKIQNFPIVVCSTYRWCECWLWDKKIANNISTQTGLVCDTGSVISIVLKRDPVVRMDMIAGFLGASFLHPARVCCRRCCRRRRLAFSVLCVGWKPFAEHALHLTPRRHQHPSKLKFLGDLFAQKRHQREQGLPGPDKFSRSSIQHLSIAWTRV